jgi:hypothetical protein
MAEKHPTEAEADDRDSIKERGIRLKGEHVARVVGLFDENVRVTNTAQISIEQSLAESEKAIARDMTGALSVRAIERAIADSGIAFTAEQRAAIYALGRGGGLTMRTGVAGACKTTPLEPLVRRGEPTRGSANTTAR